MEIDFREMGWFVGVTMAINCLVFVVCGALELVERYGLFQEAKIQRKVSKHVRSSVRCHEMSTYIPFFLQPLTCIQPSLGHVIKHLLKLHLLVQPVGLPAFYLIMKWRGVEFGSPLPTWLERTCIVVASVSLSLSLPPSLPPSLPLSLPPSL